ncbi:hypothetical protein EVAR_75827_1 [Eumeta japonica]|uniref:Uncharacterized protein n=1 Tax=Eumeta variegata TaxID=151549 RepID=A0A4C1TGI1_EUMVA|nr:hypothetical protein EVAR_75827_1 [Eumeta japonica]
MLRYRNLSDSSTDVRLDYGCRRSGRLIDSPPLPAAPSGRRTTRAAAERSYPPSLIYRALFRAARAIFHQ